MTTSTAVGATLDELSLVPVEELRDRAWAARRALGDRAVILGHHYQKDEVMEFADITGDSFLLAQRGAAATQAELVVFLGVYFMAESAYILASPASRSFCRTSARAATWPNAQTSSPCVTPGISSRRRSPASASSR